MTSLYLKGITDEHGLKFANESKITTLGFDLRPTSFQFIQEYRLIELLSEYFNDQCTYVLHFDEEKEFVIERFLSDIKKDLEQALEREDILRFFQLEFSDRQRSTFYESFERPYFWHIRDDVVLADHLSNSHLQGLILSFAAVEKMQLTGQLDEFYQNVLLEMSRLAPVDRPQIVIDCDWDSNLFPSLLETLTPHFLSLSLNEKVEKSYRLLDPLKLEQGLHFYNNFIQENTHENSSQ